MDILQNSYDLIFAGIILISVIFAAIRGGVAEALSLSVWFLAFIAIHRYGALIARYIPPSIISPIIRSIIVFVAVFVALAIIMTIIKKLCRGIIASCGLNGLDRLLGVGFGIVRGIVICAIIVILVAIFHLDPDRGWQKARLYPIISPVVNFASNTIAAAK